METENPKPQTGGLKLMTVFIAVLALHVLVIGGISAYHIFKRTAGDMSQQTQPADSTEAVKPEAVTPEALQADANAPAPTPTDSQVTDTNAPTAPVADASVSTPVTPVAPVAPVAPVEPTHAKAPVAADTAVKTSMQEVTVKQGDSLYKIAKQNHTTVAAIKQLNSLSNDNLKIGQKLKVEAKGAPVAPTTSTATEVASTVKPAPVKATAKTVAASATVYTVSKGDTLTKIARQFKTTASAIMSANKMTDPSKLSIGAKLKIPGQQASIAPVVAPVEKAASAKPAPAPSSDLVMAR